MKTERSWDKEQIQSGREEDEFQAIQLVLGSKFFDFPLHQRLGSHSLSLLTDMCLAFPIESVRVFSGRSYIVLIVDDVRGWVVLQLLDASYPWHLIALFNACSNTYDEEHDNRTE